MLFCLKLIHFLIKESPFKKFHIVSPVAKFEAKQSYAFLEEWSGDKEKSKQVWIYPSASPPCWPLCAPGRSPRPLVIWIDDAAAASAEAIKKCPYLPDVACTARHRKVLLILCSHSLQSAVTGMTGVLSPFIRQNTAYLVM